MATVTCRTDGCQNYGHPIDLELTSTDPDTGDTITAGAVICGVCGHAITEIVP